MGKSVFLTRVGKLLNVENGFSLITKIFFEKVPVPVSGSSRKTRVLSGAALRCPKREGQGAGKKRSHDFY